MEIPTLSLEIPTLAVDAQDRAYKEQLSPKSALPKSSQFVPQVLSQLQACGIVEAITISAAGFPVR